MSPFRNEGERVPHLREAVIGGWIKHEGIVGRMSEQSQGKESEILFLAVASCFLSLSCLHAGVCVCLLVCTCVSEFVCLCIFADAVVYVIMKD